MEGVLFHRDRLMQATLMDNDGDDVTPLEVLSSIPDLGYLTDAALQGLSEAAQHMHACSGDMRGGERGARHLSLGFPQKN